MGSIPWVGKIPWRRAMATHSAILAWRVPWTEEPGGCSPWGHKESDTTDHTKGMSHLSINDTQRPISCLQELPASSGMSLKLKFLCSAARKPPEQDKLVTKGNLPASLWLLSH